MHRCAFLFVLIAYVTGPARGQFVAPDILAAIDTVYVTVSVSASGDAESCIPFQSTIKTGIELALRRGDIKVAESAPAGVHFSLTAINPTLCAVAYTTEIVFWLHGIRINAYAVGLRQSGIFSNGTYTDSRTEVRQLAEDAADLVINEILKARSSQ